MKSYKKYIHLTIIASIFLSGVLLFSGCTGSTSINTTANRTTAVNSDIKAVAETASSSVAPKYEIILKSKDETIFKDELWIKYPDGREEKLITSKPDENLEKNIGAIWSADKSPDETKVYFLTEAWVTSGAVHVISLKDKTDTYLCAGNSLNVVKSGTYKGYLVVNKHRYLKGGGSYDHNFLVDENGKEVKDLGEDFDMEELIK